MAELSLGHEEKQSLALLILFVTVAVALALAILATSIAKQDVLRLMVFLSVVGFVVVFPFPKAAVVIVILFVQVLYLLTSFYGSLISYPVLPPLFASLREVVLLALLGNLTLTKLLRKQAPEKSPGLIPLGLLFMVGFISGRLNDVPTLTGLVGQRYVFEMVILYLAIVNLDLSERFLRSLIYLILAIGVFQGIIGIIEFIDKYRLYMAGNHDIVQGTWGGGSANAIGIFFLCLSFIVLARLRRAWHGVIGAVLGFYVLMLVLSSCRTGIVLAPLAFLFVLREKLRNPKYWIAMAVALVFLVGSLVFYYRNTEAQAARDLGGSEFVFQVTERTRVIPIMGQVLRNNAAFPLLGAGPGTYRTRTGDIYGSKMYLQVEAMVRTEEVVAPFIDTSYAVVWMEYGVVGLVLFGLAMVRLFFFAWREERFIRSFFWRDYFRALQAIILIYAFVGGIFALWTHFQSNIYLWVFSAIGVRYSILRKREARQAARAVHSEQEAALPRPARPVHVGSMAVNR